MILAVAARSRACTASGVLTGVPMPHQVLETTPGMPSSAKVGTSGRGFSRLAWATASARSLPLARFDLSPVRSLTIMSTSPESSASVRRLSALEPHAEQIGAGLVLEELREKGIRSE